MCAPVLTYFLTYCPSCHRQLDHQQSLYISGSLEPRSVRSPMNVPKYLFRRYRTERIFSAASLAILQMEGLLPIDLIRFLLHRLDSRLRFSHHQSDQKKQQFPMELIDTGGQEFQWPCSKMVETSKELRWFCPK